MAALSPQTSVVDLTTYSRVIGPRERNTGIGFFSFHNWGFARLQAASLTTLHRRSASCSASDFFVFRRGDAAFFTFLPRIFPHDCMLPGTLSSFGQTSFLVRFSYCPEINAAKSPFFGPSVAPPSSVFRRHLMGAILVISIMCVYVFLCATSGIESLAPPASSNKSTASPARKD